MFGSTKTKADYDRIDAEREEEARRWEAYKVEQAALGWKPMAKEPAIPPMWQCLRCSTLAFDKDVHDAFHARVGD